MTPRDLVFPKLRNPNTWSDKTSKKSPLRGPFHKQHAKVPEALLKSASQHLSPIHWQLLSQLSRKKSLFLTCQNLGLLLNTLAAHEKNPVLKRDNLTIPIEMQLSQKQKILCQYFIAFLKSRLNFQHFDKNNDAYRFCNFEITHSENVLRKMSKEPRYREPFDTPHGKSAEALLKSASQHLYHIHWSLPSQLSWKTSLFLTCQILGHLLNTLAADQKYPVVNRDNLTIPIKMQLSQKQKKFSELFAASLKSTISFQCFEKKMTLIDLLFPKLQTPKTWSDKCLKSHIREDPSTSNMVKFLKHCWNLHHSTFFIFTDHFQSI